MSPVGTCFMCCSLTFSLFFLARPSNYVLTCAPFTYFRILAILEDAPIVSSTMIDGAFCLLRFVPDGLLEELLVHATERSVSPAVSSSATTSRSQSVSPATAPASSVTSDRSVRDTPVLLPPSPLVNGSANSHGTDMHPISTFVAHMSPTATTAQFTLNAFASASYDSHDSRSSCASLEPDQPPPVSLAHTPVPVPQAHPAVNSAASAPAALTTSNVSLMKRIVSAEKNAGSHSGSSKSGSGSRPGTARTSPSSSANSSSCNSIDAEEVQAGAGVKVDAIVSSGKSKEEM